MGTGDSDNSQGGHFDDRSLSQSPVNLLPHLAMSDPNCGMLKIQYNLHVNYDIINIGYTILLSFRSRKGTFFQFHHFVFFRRKIVADNSLVVCTHIKSGCKAYFLLRSKALNIKIMIQKRTFGTCSTEVSNFRSANIFVVWATLLLKNTIRIFQMFCYNSYATLLTLSSLRAFFSNLTRK